MNFESRTVGVIGLGKLGLPLALAMAARGVIVIATDKDQGKVDAVGQLKIPEDAIEPDLGVWLEKAGGRLSTVRTIEELVQATEISFVVVPTPSGVDDRFNNDAVVAVCKEIGQALPTISHYHTVVIVSTVMPLDTGGVIRETLEHASGLTNGAGFGLLYNPEFIALGQVIGDILGPDFILIGESDNKHAGNVLIELYGQICFRKAPVWRTSYVNAELAKLALNCYITMKISFANLLAWLCQEIPGANVDHVTGAIGLDRRISPVFLIGATPYGGPCFPRDNRAMISLADDFIYLNPSLLYATDETNVCWVRLVLDWIWESEMLVNGDKVAILGRSYKPGIRWVEEGAGHLIGTELEDEGWTVLYHEPVFGAAPAQLIVDQADLVLIMLPVADYGTLQFKPGQKVIDFWRILSPDHDDCDGAVEIVRFGIGPTS